MPRKQVYGKRSRAIYDPFQAFVSPQRAAPKSNIRDQGVFVAEVIEELSRLRVEEHKTYDGSRKGRKALGERSVNEMAEPVKAVLDAGNTKRRRKKDVEEDSEDVENSGPRAVKDVKDSPRRRRRSLERSVGNKTTEKTRTPTDFVADNVPMFIDGHGYETEAEEPVTSKPVAMAIHQQTRTKETSQDSDLPSVAILPPTPPAEDDAYTTHCTSLLGLSSHGISNFTEWSNQLMNHFAITKIAEASFGEVYRLSLLEDLSAFSHADESVLKIIALKPPGSTLPPTSTKRDRAAALKKTEAMSKVDDVANEVRLLQRMSTIPGFTNFRDVRIMKGRPPQPFIKAFKDFNVEQKSRKKEPSVFPDPAKKTSYADDQLWAVIEMQDAGTDLERHVEQGQCSSIWSVWDIFWQVTLTLAKGEEGAGFEHRDLHLGNICVRWPSGAEPKDGEQSIDTKRKLHFTTLETTIIDYTISRALLASSTSNTNEGKDVAFHDLSAPQSASIFEGDSTEEYQYDIYRYMRGCVLAGDPYYNPPTTSSNPTTTSSPSSAWLTYTPRTNLLWLHFLLHSLLEQLLWPSATKAPPKNRNSGNDHVRWKRGNDLEHVLLRVQELLDPGVVCADDGSGLGSAGALVGLALEEGWLDVGDVVGSEENEELVEGFEGLGWGVEVVGEGDTLGEMRDEVVAQEQDSTEIKKPAKSRRKKSWT